jgi:hypothetical protein
LAKRQPVWRDDLFPDQLVGGTPAHASNIQRSAGKLLSGQHGVGCDEGAGDAPLCGDSRFIVVG